MKLVVEMLNLVIDWLDTGCEENWEMKVNFQVLGLSNWLNGGIFQWDQNPEGRSGWELKKGQRRSSQFSVWHILRFKCLWHMFLEIFISQSYMQVWGEKREVQIWKVFNHDFFKHFSCTVFLLFSFWDSDDINVRSFGIISGDSKVPEALFFFFYLSCIYAAAVAAKSL